jgi:hypothetical protein
MDARRAALRAMFIGATPRNDNNAPFEKRR